MRATRTAAALGFALALLGACGGSGGTAPPEPPPDTAPRLEPVREFDQGPGGLAFAGGRLWLALGTDAGRGSALLSSAPPHDSGAAWAAADLGDCSLPRSAGQPPRAARLAAAAGALYLLQPAAETAAAAPAEHGLCRIDLAAGKAVPADAGLVHCAHGYCSVLWPTQLAAVGGKLYHNGGAGPNLLVSLGAGGQWSAVLGRLEPMVCTHQAFHLAGSDLWVGGECPLDFAYLRRYRLTPDGTALATPDALPLQLPALDNRNIQFIDALPDGGALFAGAEGALLRSTDAGQSFQFVVHDSGSGGRYAYLTQALFPRAVPGGVLVGGFDKVAARPVLLWSSDAGSTWRDLSAQVPVRGAAGALNAISGLAQDAEGRVYVAVSQDEQRRGALLRLLLRP